MADISKIQLPNGDEYDIKDVKSRMVILKYGISTWDDFITAYDNKTVIYCRASSGSNPAVGSQTRLAFMAYVNDETTPTEVEFQYYRSMSSHSDTNQGDQVFIYKLNKTNGWSLTVRNAYTKVIAGSGLESVVTTGTSSTITLSLDDSNASRGDVLVYDGTSMIAQHGWYATDATWIGYDNSSSGLSADYVGEAIDELKEMIESATQYKSGDTISLVDGIFAGSWYAPKTLFFYIPLPKGTDNVTVDSSSISGNWIIRAGTGGQIVNNATLASVGAVDVYKRACGIHVKVVLNTAPSGYTTNQVCTAYGNTGAKITFD